MAGVPDLSIFERFRFERPPVDRRVYAGLPRLDQGTARYVHFAPLDRLNFDPDIHVDGDSEPG